MPESYAVVIYPLLDKLMREVQDGTPSSALAESLVRRLTAFAANVTIISRRDRKVVTLHWRSDVHHSPKLRFGAGA